MLDWRCFSLVILSHRFLQFHRFYFTYWNSILTTNLYKTTGYFEIDFYKIIITIICVYDVYMCESQSALVEVGEWYWSACSLHPLWFLGSDSGDQACMANALTLWAIWPAVWPTISVSILVMESHVSSAWHLSLYETKLAIPKLFSHIYCSFSPSETYFWNFIFPYEYNIHLLFLKLECIWLDEESTADSDRDGYCGILLLLLSNFLCIFEI